MRIFGIDASVTCTAVCRLDGDDTWHDCFMNGKTKFTKRWTDMVLEYGQVHKVVFMDSKDYSERELLKHVSYRENARHIGTVCGFGPGDLVRMEAYAFRATGNMADLVTYGTFIREAVLSSGATLEVVAPTSLKTSLAALVYGQPDKKKPPRNELGLAGGKFTKREMLEAVWKRTAGDRFWAAVNAHGKDALSVKAVPSPLGDCVDAYALCVTAR